MIAGRPSITNQDLNNLHHAHERVLTAPAILAHLSYDEVGLLVTSAASVLNASSTLTDALPYALNLRVAELLHRYACAEQATRSEHRAFGGSGVSKREAA